MFYNHQLLNKRNDFYFAVNVMVDTTLMFPRVGVSKQREGSDTNDNLLAHLRDDLVTVHVIHHGTTVKIYRRCDL